MVGRSPRRVCGWIIALLALVLIVVTVTAGSSTATLAATLPVEILAQEPTQFDEEFVELRTRVEGLENLVNVAFLVVGLLLAVGTGVSLVGFYRAEQRTAESHALSIAGEAAAQSRANEIHSTFLTSSKIR
jgi:uncharacterized membrane protein